MFIFAISNKNFDGTRLFAMFCTTRAFADGLFAGNIVKLLLGNGAWLHSDVWHSFS